MSFSAADPALSSKSIPDVEPFSFNYSDLNISWQHLLGDSQSVPGISTDPSRHFPLGGVLDDMHSPPLALQLAAVVPNIFNLPVVIAKTTTKITNAITTTTINWIERSAFLFDIMLI
ncbi:hypothetical protein HYU06_06005 [Candidatus Woesearchaeota archaeon]|nr:hypothetical protein [Candidatus Woesearchaeota archaeon]